MTKQIDITSVANVLEMMLIETFEVVKGPPLLSQLWDNIVRDRRINNSRPSLTTNG